MTKEPSVETKEGKMKLKIGQKLYQYAMPQVLSYTITGINELKTDEHTEVFYIIKCEECRDHENCILAVKIDDYGKIKYSHMINNYYDDDDCGENEHNRNSQYYWHTSENSEFRTTKQGALIDRWEFCKKSCEKDLEKAQKSVEYNEKHIEDYKIKISILQSEKKEQK